MGGFGTKSLMYADRGKYLWMCNFDVFRDALSVPVGFYNHNPKIDVSTKKQKSQNKTKKLAIVKNVRSPLSFELTQKS